MTQKHFFLSLSHAASIILIFKRTRPPSSLFPWDLSLQYSFFTICRLIDFFFRFSPSPVFSSLPLPFPFPVPPFQYSTTFQIFFVQVLFQMALLSSLFNSSFYSISSSLHFTEFFNFPVKKYIFSLNFAIRIFLKPTHEFSFLDFTLFIIRLSILFSHWFSRSLPLSHLCLSLPPL